MFRIETYSLPCTTHRVCHKYFTIHHIQQFYHKKATTKRLLRTNFPSNKTAKTTEYAIFHIPTSISFLILQPDLKHAVLLSVNLHRTRFKHFQKQVTFKFPPRTIQISFRFSDGRSNSIELNFPIN